MPRISITVTPETYESIKRAKPPLFSISLFVHVLVAEALAARAGNTARMRAQQNKQEKG